MTLDDIIQMARDAGIMPTVLNHWPFELQRFAKLVAEYEREECAKVCEQPESYALKIKCPDKIPGCTEDHYLPAYRPKKNIECAAAIRARGQQ